MVVKTRMLALALLAACASSTRPPAEQRGAETRAGVSGEAAEAATDASYVLPLEAPACNDAAVPEGFMCSNTRATLAGDCDYALVHRLSPERACMASVLLDGQALTCNGVDGWESVDAFHIRLRGAACERARSSEAADVRVDIPCHPIGIDVTSGCVN